MVLLFLVRKVVVVSYGAAIFVVVLFLWLVLLAVLLWLTNKGRKNK